MCTSKGFHRYPGCLDVHRMGASAHPKRYLDGVAVFGGFWDACEVQHVFAGRKATGGDEAEAMGCLDDLYRHARWYACC